MNTINKTKIVHNHSTAFIVVRALTQNSFSNESTLLKTNSMGFSLKEVCRCSLAQAGTLSCVCGSRRSVPGACQRLSLMRQCFCVETSNYIRHLMF